MRTGIRCLLAIVAGVALASTAHAAKSTAFTAVLTGGQVPNISAGLTPSPGFGVLFGTLTGRIFCFSVNYQGLVGTETVSHFHGPAVPGDVSTNHLFPEKTPGCVAADCPSLPQGSPKDGCTGPLDKAALKALKKGQWYINIHSNPYMNGEIRGQVLPIKGVTFKSQ